MTRQLPDHPPPKAPTYQELPTAKSRAVRGGPELREIRVHLEVVTPIFGGSHQTRAIDDIDVIRAPSVRGHLRFWWRALYAARYESTETLYKRESALWGRAATNDGGRSEVEIRVSERKPGSRDGSNIDLQQTPDAYALWPARAERQPGQVEKPPAPRRKPGTKFLLTLKVAGTDKDEAEVKNALRAWILFGGYGGRTRRGLGSLKVIGDAKCWLPTAATREALTSLFGFDIFADPSRTPGDVPWLGGASLHVGSAERNAQTAWTTALNWLREFRQGTPGARKPGPPGNTQRPSISNWPEADKVRQLSTPKGGLPWAHTPRHDATPAWPRASFGLPIIGQFQAKSRQLHPTRKKRNGRPDEKYWHELPQNHPNYGTEPEGFELRWRSLKPDRPEEFEEHDRLASPLIVKALPLADGSFVPCALWLNRGYPNGAEVGLARPKRNQPNEKEVDPATVAPFDRLVAPGDTAQFPALANKTSLRQAFLDWLHTTCETAVLAP